MPQFNKGDTFVNGQQVDGPRLNNLVDNATALPGLITNQTDIAPAAVTGKSFTSATGKTAIVTSVAHGLTTGMEIVTTASVGAFSGRFAITVISVDSFSFTLAQAYSSSVSGTLDYVRVDLVTASDTIMIHDQSATALKMASFDNVLKSGLDAYMGVVTAETCVISTINGMASSDINQTPNDALTVSGKAFNSVDGITAVVTSTGHGLETGMMLDVTASNAVYSGQHFITVLTVDTFSFVISQTTPVAASGTVDYTKQGTVKTLGNHYVAEKLKVVGETILDGNLTSKGTANFTGDLKVNGVVGYVLTEIVEQSFTFSGTTTISTWTNAFTTASYTKPAGEIWMVEFDFRYRQEVAVYMAIRFNQTSTSTTLDGTFNIEGGGTNYFHIENCILRHVFQNASTFTSTFTLDFQPSASGTSVTVGEATFPYAGIFTGITMPASKFRIYKYKTA